MVSHSTRLERYNGATIPKAKTDSPELPQTTALVTSRSANLTHTRSILPPLLPREPLVEQREYLGYVELHVLKIEVVLVVLLHLQQIVKLEIQLEQATIPTYSR